MYITIGSLYLIFSFLMFLFSGLLILGVRLELLNPGINIMPPEYFNSLVTIHGLIMILAVIVPCFFGFAYWIIPNLIYNKKMFFYKISFINFFIYFFSTLLIILTFFMPYNEGLSVGWTLYTPLSIQMGNSIDFLIFSVILISISSFLNAINIATTIMINYKDNLYKITIFLLCFLVTSYLIIIVSPVLIGLMLMIFFDRKFETSFFNPIYGGDVLMYQHIFWFFGHPEVYIMILPAFGSISQIIPVFCKKVIFGYKSMIYSILSITLLSLMVWGHHMFCTGLSYIGQNFFMYCTILISIPTGIKVFNWIFTIWRSFINFETPMLFSLSFLIFFIIGGFSGLILSVIPLNIYLHGTYFVVAHFHYVLVSSVLFALYSLFYYWSPMILKSKFNNYNSKIHFWSSFIFINLTFFPMHFLGLKGMPRRYIDYPIKYNFLNKFITIFSFMFGISQIYFLYYILFPIIF